MDRTAAQSCGDVILLVVLSGVLAYKYIIQPGFTRVGSTSHGHVYQIPKPTPLILAIRKHDLSETERLLKRGAEITPAGEPHNNALVEAVNEGERNVFELVLEHAENLDAEGEFDLTALGAALEKQNTDFARLLIEAGADLNQHWHTSSYAINTAVLNNSLELVQLLLDEGADPKVADVDGYRTLNLACRENVDPSIVELLINAGADVNRQGPLNMFPDEEGRAFFSMGDDKRGHYPLHLAAINLNTEVLKLLLDANADPDVGDWGQGTPLFSAIKKGHTEGAKLLLKAGADPELANIHNASPLMVAAANNRIELAEILIEMGSELDRESEHGETPLNLASRAGSMEIVKMLLKHGADPNYRNINEKTARDKVEEHIAEFPDRKETSTIEQLNEVSTILRNAEKR